MERQKTSEEVKKESAASPHTRTSYRFFFFFSRLGLSVEFKSFHLVYAVSVVKKKKEEKTGRE